MKPELNQTVCVVCSAVGDIVAAGVIPDVRSFEWSADARCLYYCLADEHGRPSKVWLTACLSGCQAMLLPVWFWKSSLVTAFDGCRAAHHEAAVQALPYRGMLH